MKKGFTLIEVLVSTAIFVILAMVIYATTAALIRESGLYRENTTLSGLADQYLEVAHNLPYSQIGTLNGNPHGPLPDLPNAVATILNGVTYQMYYAVSYVDDPADGTALLGADSAPNDYKQLKFYIKNTATGIVSSFFTTIAPKGLENLAGGGALSIKVFDSMGIAVPYANISITNTTLASPINVSRVADGSGIWVEAGLPASSNSYHVVVTKSGDSTDQTYPISGGNSNPTKPDATILSGQVTAVSFAIDDLSSLTLNTLSNQSCAPIAESGIGLRGAKLIGTPNVLKFSNTYTSNSSGKIILNNIEWDNYTPSLTTTNYMLYGSTPAQPFTITPNTSPQTTLVYGPKTTNSLLVSVKDSVTGASINNSTINLISSNPSYNVSTTTPNNGSCLSSGQAMFAGLGNGSNYTAIVNSSGYQTKTIGNLNISGNNILQVSLSH